MNNVAIVALIIIFPVLIITAYNFHSESASSGSNWVAIGTIQNSDVTVSVDKSSIDKSQNPTKAFVQFAYADIRESYAKEYYNRDVHLIDFYCETRPVKIQMVSSARYLDNRIVDTEDTMYPLLEPGYVYPDTDFAKIANFVCS